MKQKELDKIIKLHEKWLNGEHGGKCADLINADLRNLDLSGANLSEADLSDADLSDADLRYANLDDANLIGANLIGANLYDVNLSGTNLDDANLSGANLIGANLYDVNLSGANLSEAIIKWVNWHESKGLKVYEAQLNSSRENAQLAYIPSLDVATTGCWQNTWEATKKRVSKVYQGNDEQIYHKYQLAFQYIKAQMEADK